MLRWRTWILGLILAAALPLAAAAQTTIMQPDSAGQGANPITSTINGSHVGLDINLPAGSVSLTVPPYQIATWNFYTFNVPATSAMACNCGATSTVFIAYNGSTAATVWLRPGGTAAVGAGFPLTKSGVAYDHYFGLPNLSIKALSCYNSYSATATIALACGR